MHVVFVDSSGQRKNKSCIFLCVCTQERHHRVIRRAVVNRLNKTSLEQGLAEDLAVVSIRQLRLEPLRNGFVKPHPPSASMLHSLTQHLGCSGQNVTTCVAARSGAVTLHRGDCAIYTFDGTNMLAGDILFFASSREWGECAFLGAWVRSHVQPDASMGCWKLDVLDDIVRVPIGNLKAAAAAHIGARTATVICPAAFLVH